MKVWITKFALTKGIYEAEKHVSADGTEYGRDSQHSLTREWAATREEALAKAREMRDRKIANLQKQITKLEKMVFE